MAFFQELLSGLWPQRPVVDSMKGFGTAKAIGRAMREGRFVDIEGTPLFFRDAPSEAAQKRITKKLGNERVFTPEELAAIAEASAVNKALNDETLRSMQALYDSHDPRVLAGMAAVGLLGGTAAGLMLTPRGPAPQPMEQGAS